MAWDDCFERALEMRDLLAGYDGDALSEAEQARAEAVCLSIFPLIFECVAAGEFADSPEAVADAARIDGPIGVGFQALWRRDLSEQVCRAVFPALWPSRHMEVVRWWEDKAREQWLAPRLESAGEDGAFARILSQGARLEGEAYARWGQQQHTAWKNADRLSASLDALTP